MSINEKHEERYIHGYDDWARQWMSERSTARDLAFLVPYLRAGMDVIDCGCGPGSITVGLAEIVAPGTVTGVDIEPRQLDLARALALERGVANAQFEKASVYELPCADASFDVAVAHFVIEHISEPVRALHEIRRVLRPGGIAAIKDPYYPAFTFRPALPAMQRYEELTAKVRSYSGASDTYAADLRARLLDAGFDRTEAQAGVLTVAGGGPDTSLFRLVRGNQLREPTFRDVAISQGWATEADLNALCGASKIWPSARTYSASSYGLRRSAGWASSPPKRIVAPFDVRFSNPGDARSWPVRRQAPATGHPGFENRNLLIVLDGDEIELAGRHAKVRRDGYGSRVGLQVTQPRSR